MDLLQQRYGLARAFVRQINPSLEPAWQPTVEASE
jgi:hypothetical protein